jgi:DNA-binding HxlR family transcriptional regulator
MRSGAIRPSKHVVRFICKKNKRHVIWNSQNLAIDAAEKQRFMVFSLKTPFSIDFLPKTLKRHLRSLVKQFMAFKNVEKNNIKPEIKLKKKIFSSSNLFF